MEVVKAISPDEVETRENDPDQVALESVDQDHPGASSSVHSFPQHIPLSIGLGPGPQSHGPGPAGPHGPILGHGPSRGK